jgi:tetratricopeptide (TPR) repeat protein
MNRLANARLLRVAGQQFQKGNHEAASAACRSLLEADPTHLGALELMAKCLWAKQDFVALEQATRCLIALNPYEPGYFGLRGMALRALGRYGEATQALRRDPNSTSQLADLEAFQSTLIRDLIEHDAVFAAQYAKSPETATRVKGLASTPPNRTQAGAPGKTRKSLSIRQYS